MPDTPRIQFLNDTNPNLFAGLDSADFQNIRDRFADNGSVVSLSMPMEKAGAETRKNPIVFKNTVTKAIEEIENREGEHRDLLFHLRALKDLDDPTIELWQHQNQGLLLFVNGGDEILGVRLPYTVSADVEIGDSPYLRPLYRLANLQRYFVLALDLNELALYESTRWTLKSLPLENVPTSLAEAMKYDDPEESLQFRSSTPAQGKAGPAPIYHGHGVTTDATENEKIRRYFEMVSQNIAENFPDRQTDLILLGPDSQRSRYREVNHYERLSESEIDLNPSNRSEDEIQQIIGEHIQKLADAALKEDLELLREHCAADKGSGDIAEVATAAITGKVDTIYYHPDSRLFGKADQDTLTIDIHDEPSPTDVELIGYCVDRAMETGARLRPVDSEALKLPGDSCVAATFRY